MLSVAIEISSKKEDNGIWTNESNKKGFLKKLSIPGKKHVYFKLIKRNKV